MIEFIIKIYSKLHQKIEIRNIKNTKLAEIKINPEQEYKKDL